MVLHRGDTNTQDIMVKEQLDESESSYIKVESNMKSCDYDQGLPYQMSVLKDELDSDSTGGISVVKPEQEVVDKKCLA